MKTIRLAAAMSLLQIDRHCAQAGLRIVRIILGREAKKRGGMTSTPEREHLLLVTAI
tara:strand:- start:928 stop:1098 length:171 start_codon:yes stop_codon:yes gene_type:complete